MFLPRVKPKSKAKFDSVVSVWENADPLNKTRKKPTSNCLMAPTRKLQQLASTPTFFRILEILFTT